MSIFTKIRDKIFGRRAAPAATAPQPAPAAPKPAQPPAAAAAAAKPAPAPAPAPVDVEEVLTEMASESGQKLNWRTSIVDLMKLLGLESSLSERKELAVELGYKGATDGSAEMNIWLHKAVMKKLAENGGKVPPELRD